MAISSINIQPSSGNAIIHNERIFDVAYALKNDDVNEYHRFTSISETRKAIYEDYKLHHGRKLNTKATPIREAVVNLNENHKMEDLINLSQMLENDYQMKVLHIAIHRDEGHIDKDGKENINYHAHIVFHNYDFDKHITIKRDKDVMRKLQTDVAKSLGMERGLENSQAVRLDHRQYKRAMQEVEIKTKDLKSELTKVKEENQELKKYDFKEMQKTITSLENLTVEQKKELHQLNSQVKNQAATIEELQEKINSLTVKNKDNIERLIKRDKEIVDLKSLTSTLAAESVSNFEESEKQKENVKALENQNKALQEQINTKPVQSIENELKALVSSEINLNDIKKNSLDFFTSDFKEEINLKENGVFNKTYKIELKQEFKTQEITLENIGLFKRTQIKIMNLLETIKNQALRIAGLKKENQLLNSELKNEKLKNQSLEIKVIGLEIKIKTLSLTGEKKETALDKIVSNFDKKEILETSKKEKDQEEVKENTNTKRQNYGYELR